VITYLDDVLDPSELALMLDEGYIQVRHHPDYPFVIYCYTKKAMFDRVWNNTTMTCRGLIVNEETGEVLARPFRKFFNYGEPSCPELNPNDFVQVYDKVDGSLGIVYNTPNGPQIASKGSFTSDQALHATNLLQTLYVDYRAIEGITDLFEIVYPDNRIVLDYGERDELVYLGSVGIGSGDSYYRDMLHMPHAERGSMGLLKDVLPIYLDMKRPNAEGVVIHAEEKDIRVKVKQQDYIELHRVMTGLNERQLWEWLSEGKEVDEILIDLPEEIHGWAEPILESMHNNYLELIEDIYTEYVKVWKITDRKEFALSVKHLNPWMHAAMFMMKDQNDDKLVPHIWKAVRP
jgi:RNA ligase